MSAGGRRSLLLVVGLLAVVMSGCTFRVQMSNGRVSQVTIPDQEIQRFLNRMDSLTLQVLRETQQLQDDGLRQVVVEMRQAYFRFVRHIGANQGTPANPSELQLKVQAFEIQMARRLTTPERTIRYRTLRSYFEQLKQEIGHFYSVIERAAR